MATLLLPVALTAQMRELSFYEVRPKKSEIIIDGKLDEKAWQNIPVHSNYYEYWKSNPKPGALDTSFRMLYDANGLYMAVVNYEDNITALRRTIFEYDNGSIWQDDCGEFFFDPVADGIGYTKFTINANGAFADMRRQDLAVYLNDWSGTGTVVKASVGKNAWYIEAFFPWEDLNGIGKEGSLWQFCHARFSWTKNFRGMASSPGGNYNATDKFGYLYFSDGKTELSPNVIGNLLKTKAAIPWCIPCGNILISYRGTILKTDELDELIAQEKNKMRYYALEIAALEDKSLDAAAAKVLKELNGTEKLSKMILYKTYQSVNNALFDIKWQKLLNNNLR